MIAQRLLLLNKGQAEPPLRSCHLSSDLEMMLGGGSSKGGAALHVAFFFVVVVLLVKVSGRVN